MWALSLALTILSLWLLILNLSHPNVPVFLYWAEDTLLAVGYSTVGAVAASHRPGNPVGWVLCSIGLSWGWPISPASMPPTRCWQRQGRSRLLKPRPGSTLGFGFLVWVSSCSCLCCSQVVVCLLLAGVHSRGSASCWRGRERSWRRSLRHRALALASGILSGWRVCRTSPSSFRRSCSLDIRRISLLGRAPASRERSRAPADQMGGLCWRTGGGASLPTYTVLEAVDLRWLYMAGYVPALVGIVGVPTAVGIAITRYRLYNIDILINRTLVYGTLTAMLVAL